MAELQSGSCLRQFAGDHGLDAAELLWLQGRREALDLEAVQLVIAEHPVLQVAARLPISGGQHGSMRT